ncbi:MAG: exodeoxyribonuclease VII small subunit [Candidatus Kerfeldbacteria bacterium]|nr:exodeoxyribonuclease VII small subunit [Candidatus Kerfeldbacteria bacterium]
MTKKSSFHEQLKKLEEITAYLEQPDLDLEQGLGKFEEGLKLAKELKSRLHSLEQTIETIKEKFHDNQVEGDPS